MSSVQTYVRGGSSRPAPPGGPLRVDVSALAGSPITCGSVVYRHRGQLRVTAVVKARFRLVHDGPATVASPEEIRAEEEHHGGDPAGSLRSASDLVPHRPRADVVFVGHAHAGAGAAPASSARLAVFRERALIDKTIHVYGDWSDAAGGGAPGAAPRPFERMPLVYERAYASPGDRSSVANPVGTPRPNLVDPRDPRRPIGFGPIARAWPIRARLLGEADRRALDAPLPELSDAFDWRYFQAAPPDQQVDALQGDEWIVLDGLHPSRARIQTRLPSAAPVARVHRRTGPGADGGQPLALVLDTLAIDGDQQACDLVWRGSVPVPEGEAGLPLLQILVGLKLPERRPARAPAPKTAVLSMPDHLRANAAPATPFEGGNEAPAPSPGARPETSRSSPPDIPGAPWASSPAPRAPEVGGLGGTLCVASPLGMTMGVTDVAPPVAPFPLAGPGTSRPPSAELPGAPWAAAPAPAAPQIGDAGEGTLFIMAPAEMRALLEKGRPGEPTPPQPLAPAEMRALLDRARPSEPAPPLAPPERRVARPPALPLRGSVYGKPRRKAR